MTYGDITSPPFVNRVQSTFCQSSPVHLLLIESSPPFVNRVQSTFCQLSPVHLLSIESSPPFVNRVQSTFCQSSPVHVLSYALFWVMFWINCTRINQSQPRNISLYIITFVIIYKEMFLGCDWLIRVQLIQNITQNSAKICNTVQKSVTTVQKSVTTSSLVTTVQKSVTTVQKSVISSLSDGIYSQKNQKYGGRIFTFA